MWYRSAVGGTWAILDLDISFFVFVLDFVFRFFCTQLEGNFLCSLVFIFVSSSNKNYFHICFVSCG